MWRSLPCLRSGYLGLVTPENGLELYDGQVRLIDRDGGELEKFAGENYLDYIAEHVEPGPTLSSHTTRNGLA
jgi:coenzyme F420-reducing hydrogenase alpha subunit